MTEEPTLFEQSRIEATAAEHELDPDSLAATLASHQESVEDLPGVENIVYEWRKQYEDPLLARTETAYFLVLPRQVWDEFATALGLDEDGLAAVIEVHRRTVAEHSDAPAEPGDDDVYVALDRTL
jgi:hypothetical protein